MPPRLSVVVPVYNVELFLDECLQSLADQTFTDWEAVVVDDGSTDGSLAIAERWAAKDDRIRVVPQKNQGLGPARNTGVDHLTEGTEYLAFVDSDDIVLPDAYERFVASLDKTGSDFASGNVNLLRAGEVSKSPLHQKRLRTDRERTHISRDKDLVYDRTAWNKVFRRSFWEQHRFEFPGILYEDAPVTLPAHFLAKSVDVLGEPVYLWRQRTGGAPSITQRRTEPVNVRDRIRSCDSVSRFLASQPGEKYAAHKRWYDEIFITDELPLFMGVLDEAGDEFRELFMTGAADFLGRVDPTVFPRLPVSLRLKCHLIQEKRLEELMELLAYERETGRAVPVVRQGLKHFANYPVLSGKGAVPREVLRVDADFAARARAEEVVWQNGRLRIKGHAYIRNLAAERPQPTTLRVLMLRETGSRRTVLVRPNRVQAARATQTSGQSLHNYDWSGFSLDLDPRKFKARGGWRDGVWRLTVATVQQGIVRRTRLKAGESGSAESPVPYWVESDVRVVPFVTDEHIYLRVERVRGKLTGHRVEDGVLELTGALGHEAVNGTLGLRLTHGSTQDTLAYDVERDGRTFTARIPLADLAVDGRDVANWDLTDKWTAELSVDGRFHPVAVAPGEGGLTSQYPFDGEAVWGVRSVSVADDGVGRLALRTQAAQPSVTELSVSPEGRITLAGALPVTLDEPVEIVMRHSRHSEEHSAPAVLDDGVFRAEFLPVPDSISEVPLRQGRWYLTARAAESRTEVPLRVAPAALGALPLRFTVRGRDYALTHRFFDRLLIEAAPDLLPDEFGWFRQRELRTGVYAVARTAPLRDTVLYASFSGRQYSDSPRAVYEELLRRGDDLEHIWVVEDKRAQIPEGVKVIRRWSRDWYEALGRSRYIVTNTHLPHWIRRREGQVIVQTWHGTPLKRIGHDIDSVQFADRKYLSKVAEETPSWSFLVSPNRFSTPIMKRAFQFDGEILESGYPRNDLLLAKGTEETAAEVRKRIGLPEGKKVVLYAPTWRDDQFYRAGNYKFDLRVDVKKAREKLGDDHVLLVRKHSNIVDAVPGAGDGFVFDVSSYPDIAELYLITDILVTDYSSLMFDFANTGRPMLFFTYDLEYYRDQLRGFYFDFEQQAPGPLLQTSDDLIDALGDIERIHASYADAYTEFKKMFCDLDDGHAAERVITRMLELAHPDRPATER
ncbi:CDP-glycerol glycerophosphotransferase family protein [Streptomyces roseirectus]|uniref:CDP-glycerol glycerophosphotransferase family protein n=1 Tax=Streptomyces roseirectus TaxID=2768066 RepID=A0A7H0IIY1_9ACTN|nr:bifunctional glycosyltransferase/CDP-glycerol:glycerophosphate glycerophosphotransferase [Streptomyces roseirectus]QNP72747.1 CDP-glycerol glycerophosphotransferase family protein [Streptomyces roseirectus]